MSLRGGLLLLSTTLAPYASAVSNPPVIRRLLTALPKERRDDVAYGAHLPSHSLCSPALQRTQYGASVGDCSGGRCQGKQERLAWSRSLHGSDIFILRIAVF
jgi:hypothetical protein